MAQLCAMICPGELQANLSTSTIATIHLYIVTFFDEDFVTANGCLCEFAQDKLSTSFALDLKLEVTEETNSGTKNEEVACLTTGERSEISRWGIIPPQHKWCMMQVLEINNGLSHRILVLLEANSCIQVRSSSDGSSLLTLMTNA